MSDQGKLYNMGVQCDTPVTHTHAHTHARTHTHTHTHRTGMSYHKSLLAVGEVLSFLKTKVPTCTDMVDSLLSAVHKSQVQS